MRTRHSIGGWVALALALAPLAAGSASAADAAPSRNAPQAAERSDFKSMLGDLWAKLRAISPRSAEVTASSTMTAGIRGAEATESELKPYWKGDREQNPAYQGQRKALQAAQELADAGKLAEAARAFDAFVADNPGSPFASEARFGGALAQAALGDRKRAIAGFEGFLKDNPQHPLAKDAERALGALR
jgi:TolA-binding protein